MSTTQPAARGLDPTVDQARTIAPEQRLTVQYAIARSFAEADSLDAVSPVLLTTLCDALGWQAAGLWVLADDGVALRSADAFPDAGPGAEWGSRTRDLRLRIGEGVPGSVWAAGRAIWFRDMDEEQEFPRREVAQRLGLRHAFAFPIRVRGSVVAVIELFAAHVRGLDAEQVEFLEAVGHQLGSFIERTDARRAVAESEARKAAILAAAVDAIVSADATGRILEFNDAAERMFGRRKEDVIGATLADLLVPPDLREAHQGGLRRYIATREPRILGQRVRTRAARADGTAVPVELTVTEVCLDGPPVFTAFIRDITGEREAETARDRFLEILSHELRTPVTAIYGGATLLARPSLDEARRRDLIEDVAIEADRLHRLVEDLIVLTRAERGANLISLEPVHLERVAERVVAAARAQWSSLQFRFASRGPRHAVQADETYVEQLLGNLLSNAAKYAAGGRVVDVEIDHGPEESIVRVLDRGPGIDPAEAARLFEIDYRSPLTDALAHGSGIGLFVARWVAEAMGGRIWAAPRPGGGSEFGFSLHVVPPDSGEIDIDHAPLLVGLTPDDGRAGRDASR